MSAEDTGMPPDLTSSERSAIQDAEAITAYTEQGFTRDEAMDMLKIAREAHLYAYWAHHFEAHGCGALLQDGICGGVSG